MLVQLRATKRPAENYDTAGRFAVGLDNLNTTVPIGLTFMFDDFVKLRVKMSKAEARRMAKLLAEYGRE